MSDRTKIQWTDATWSPVLGCSPASSGCLNCYAVRTTWRLAHNPVRSISGPRKGLVEKASTGVLHWTGEVRCLPDQLDLPLHWRKPRRVFVNSMSDLFHPDVPDEYIMAVFGVMAACPQHVFQVLTKRPERMRRWFAGLEVTSERCASVFPEDSLGWRRAHCLCSALIRQGVEARKTINAGDIEERGWPLLNVEVGVSVEDQPTADERIWLLPQIPAAVRFVSAEPLLGPIHLRRGIYETEVGLRGTSIEGLDWAIVGGESGPGARPCCTAWIRSLVEQCKATKVAVFVKQIGAWPYDDPSDEDTGWWPSGTKFTDGSSAIGVRLRDRKGSNPSEWPSDLRVREMPTTTRTP